MYRCKLIDIVPALNADRAFLLREGWMDQFVSGESLAQGWSLSFADLEFINTRPGAVRLGLAAQLKFFQLNGFFCCRAE